MVLKSEMTAIVDRLRDTAFKKVGSNRVADTTAVRQTLLDTADVIESWTDVLGDDDPEPTPSKPPATDAPPAAAPPPASAGTTSAPPSSAQPTNG